VELKISADPEFAADFASAMARYEAQRDALVDPERSEHLPSGGVGGSRRGVKCLHAHYADYAAGNRNPVGADTAEEIEPLDCSLPCTTEAEGVVVLNPDWIEP